MGKLPRQRVAIIVEFLNFWSKSGPFVRTNTGYLLKELWVVADHLLDVLFERSVETGRILIFKDTT
jgi:hypothetical protein